MPDIDPKIGDEIEIGSEIGKEGMTRGAVLEDGLITSSYGLMDHFRNYATHMGVTTNAHLRTYTNALHDAIYEKCGSSYTSVLAQRMPTNGYMHNTFFADLTSGGKNYHIFINTGNNYQSNQLVKMSDVSYSVGIEDVQFTSLNFVNSTNTTYLLTYDKYYKKKSFTPYCKPVTYAPTTASHQNISYWLSTTYEDVQDILPDEYMRLFKSNHVACYFNLDYSNIPDHSWSVTQHVSNYSGSLHKTQNIIFNHTYTRYLTVNLDGLPTYMFTGQNYYAYVSAYSSNGLPLLKNMNIGFQEYQYPSNDTITFTTDDIVQCTKQINNGPPYIVSGYRVNCQHTSLSYSVALNLHWYPSEYYNVSGTNIEFTYTNFGHPTRSHGEEYKRYFVTPITDFVITPFWGCKIKNNTIFVNYSFDKILIYIGDIPLNGWCSEFRANTQNGKLTNGHIPTYGEAHTVCGQDVGTYVSRWLVMFDIHDVGDDIITFTAYVNENIQVTKQINTTILLGFDNDIYIHLNNVNAPEEGIYYMEQLIFNDTDVLRYNTPNEPDWHHLGFIKFTYDYIKNSTLVNGETCYVNVFYRIRDRKLHVKCSYEGLEDHGIENNDSLLFELINIDDMSFSLHFYYLDYQYGFRNMNVELITDTQDSDWHFTHDGIVWMNDFSASNISYVDGDYYLNIDIEQY